MTNDPVLIQSTKGSNVEDSMPIGLFSKKRKTIVDPIDGTAKIKTIEGPATMESQTTLVKGPFALKGSLFFHDPSSGWICLVRGNHVLLLWGSLY